MTVTIRMVKDSNTFAICQLIGVSFVPIIISFDYAFLVSFCKAENYTWHFNLTEAAAITVPTKS